MNPTRIKICGLTDPHQARQAERLGADAIGLVFYPPSPRVVELTRAAEIASVLAPFTLRVGLFVNPTIDQVDEVLARVPLQLLQFHGDEDNNFCAGFGLPWIKALRVGPEVQVNVLMDDYPAASGFLLDSFSGQARGGTGQTFDWSLIPEMQKPFILAGGLTADNVSEAIARVRPYAVDVSSGVESAPGDKDTDKMRDFVNAVKRADQSASGFL